MKERGITLIALVITIVIMIIIVGITVLAVINSDIIGKAKESGKQTQEMAEAEPEQVDNLMNDAIATINPSNGNDLEILREFFGKGIDVVGYTDELNGDIEPIPDAPTSIRFIAYGDYIIYNGQIYQVEVLYDDDEGMEYYGDVTLKEYSDAFRTIAVQGTFQGTNEIGEVFQYNNTTYALIFETGEVRRYGLYAGDGKIYLYDFNGQKYDILSSYNPRLWIEGEEITVILGQDGQGYHYINCSYRNKQYRAVLTIDDETVEAQGIMEILE